MPLDAPVTRRALLQGGGSALAALSLGLLTPEAARAAVGQVARSGVFSFGVASGDPTATEVLLWTRVTGPRGRWPPTRSSGTCSNGTRCSPM